MSDSSSYETTYSEDERIRKEIESNRARRKKEEKEIDEQRKIIFKQRFEHGKTKPDSIFNQPGIDFIKFNHKKIKFSFEPSKVVTYASKRLIFYVSLRYINNFWLIQRNSVPISYKMNVYKKFYSKGMFRTDQNVTEGILIIYILLVQWAKEEHNFRQEKIEKYRSGEEVFLDSTDEEFLTEEEKTELRTNTENTLKRMILPTERKRRRIQTRYFLR